MTKIKIHTIQCVVPDEIDKDEMFLKYQGDKIWPEGKRYFRMDVEDKVSVGLELEVAEEWVEIELWDFDYLSLNDFLGVFKFNVNTTPGKYSTSMELKEKGSSASYLMDWEVLS